MKRKKIILFYFTKIIKLDFFFIITDMALLIFKMLMWHYYYYYYYFWETKKGTRVWQSLSHAPRYNWVSPWVPQARTEVRKLRTHIHPRPYWFLGLPEIAITVLVRTRTWDVVKSQQSSTSCTTPVGGWCDII